MSWNCPSIINDTDQQLVIHRTIFVNKTIIFSTILACTAHSGNVNGMSFTMDGLHLVTSGTDNRIRLWNIETGRNTLVNYGKIQNETRKGLQFAVSCWCKSDLIYIPDEYCNIQVYEMFTGRKIDTLRGHLQQVNCCVFHPDYQELYSGGNDRNVLIWEPELDGSYDNYLKERSSKKQTQSRSFVSRIAATADSWSSDEETWQNKYWSRHLQSAMVSLRMWPFDFSCKFWPYSVDQNGSMAMNVHTPIHIWHYFVVKESDETVCEKENRETKLK